MGNTNEVKIRITAENKTDAPISAAEQSFKGFKEEINKTLESTGKGAKSATGYFTDLMSTIKLATGTISTLQQLDQQIGLLGKQGAAVMQTKDSFDYLVKSIGATPDLLDKLRSASRGTVDDMTLMAGTLTLVAGADRELAVSLADASPRLMEIAKAAQKLNPTLGDTAFLYDSITAGIKRGQPDILDNLGIIVKVGEANGDYAKKLGKTAEQLSSAEQKQAMLNAALKAGDTLVQQAGGKIESYGDQIAALEVKQKNYQDRQKAAALPYIEFAYDIGFAQMDAMEKSGTFWAKLLPPSVSGTYTVFSTIAGEIMKLGKAEDGATPKITANEAAIRRSAQALNNAGKAANDYASKIESMTDEEKAHEAQISQMSHKYNELAHTHRDAIDQMVAKNKELADLQDQHITISTELKDATKDASKSIGEQAASSLEKYIGTGKKYKETLVAIDNATGTNLSTQSKQQDSIDALNKKYGEGKMSEDDYYLGLKAIKDEFVPFNDKVSEAQRKLADLNAQIDAMGGKRIVIDVEVVGLGSGGRPNNGVYTPSNNGYVDPGTGSSHGATGLSMIVPPGYYQDNYRVYAQSGERVEITPPGVNNGKSGSESITITGPITINGVQNVKQLTDALMIEVGKRVSRAKSMSYAGR